MQSTTNQPPAQPAARRFGWLWRPALIVFLSSASIMVLELVAGRIIAPHVGVSLYTWTSVIGVVLAGISLGNYLGGRLADRWATPRARGMRLLGIIFILSGLASLGILAVDAMDLAAQVEWPLIAEILALIAALFFLPSTILGTISPIVVKLAIRDLSKTGRTVGRIYAAGSVGSIVGTFATGFFLISWLGTHTIVWAVSLLLLFLGLLLLLSSRWLWAVAAVLLAANVTLLSLYPAWRAGPCTRETDYFCITVKEEDRNGSPVRVLILDRLVHSYSSLDDPTQLVYGYEKAYAELTAYQVERVQQAHGRPVRALFIGGGGYTFPRYMEALYPDSQLDVIEIDPGVTEVAHGYLGLDRDTKVVSYNEDARMFLERKPVGPSSPPASGGDRGEAGAYDLIFGDAFNDYSVPYHLTTKEFNDRVQAWLADDGLYLVNIIDGAYGRFLRAYTHTLRQTFDHVYLAPTIENWQEVSRSTFVLIGTDRPLDRAALASAVQGDALVRRTLLDDSEIDELLASGTVVTLTDRYAPVDQMLAPVFRGLTRD
jgi:spermidine synthase